MYKDVLKFLKLPTLDLPKYEKVFAAKYKQPKIDEDLKNKLTKFFKPYNEELYKILDINYGWEK